VSGLRVPAVGGTRTVPAPDQIAIEYLLLALRLDQHRPGLVEGYFGPADLKARVDMEQRRSPAALRDDASVLRGRLAAEVEEPDRRDWLDAQLVALEAHADDLAGTDRGFEWLATRYMGMAPERRADGTFLAALTEVASIVPGSGSLEARLEAWDRALEIPVDRLKDIVEWLVASFRKRAERDFGLPADEGLQVSLVTGQPWSGYNWYDGGLRSRVDINTDLPVRAPDLVTLTAHETFPGHHLEHAWKEADLVEGKRRLEASLLLLNAPECVVSEGLATVGPSIASPVADRVDLLLEAFERAGLALAADPARARDTAERAVALTEPREALAAIRGNVAFLRFVDGWSHEEALLYLQDVGGYSPTVAAKRLEFVEHPAFRTYVFVYADGAALIRRWLERVPEAERTDRFGRLLHEQITPGRILAESG